MKDNLEPSEAKAAEQEQVEDAVDTSVEETEADKIPFFHVSQKKFLVMFVMTLGFYSLYWFFKQWQALKEYYQLSCWPVARAFFSVFFTHSLFRYVREYIKETGRDCEWKGSNLATVYVALVVGGGVAGNVDKIVASLSNNLLLALVSVVFTFCSAVPLYQAQAVINEALQPLEFERNDKFTGFNWIWIILGAIYWGVVGLGVVTIMQTP